MIQEEEEEEDIDTLEENPISIRLSGPNEESSSNEDSVGHSPRKKLRR